MHGLQHGGIALGHDDGAVHPDAVRGVRLVLGDLDAVVLLEVGLRHELAGHQHVAVLQVVHAGLQVQDLLQLHFGTLEAPAFQDLAELADALFVRAGGLAHVEMVAHHHDVAAVQRARAHDALHVLVVEELAHGRLDLVLLAVAAVGARVRDDGAAAGDDSGILDEAGVGELLEGGQDGHFDAALLEGRDVVVMLLEGFLVIRLAEFGRGGDALDHGLGGAADDDVGELGHDGSFRERSFPFASYGAYCILYIVYNQEETGSFSELLKRGWWVSFGDG